MRPAGTTLARPIDVGFTAVLSFADPAAESRRSSTEAITSRCSGTPRLPAHGGCAESKAIANTTPGSDRQELLHLGSPTSSYGRKIGAADRSQPRPGLPPWDGTPPRGWVNMICKNARADTAQTSHPGHVSPQRPLYGSAVMPPQPRRPGKSAAGAGRG